MSRSPAVHDEPDYRQLFEAAPGLFLILKPDLTIVGASAAYLKATMTRLDDIMGRHLFDVFPDNPDDPKATGTRNLALSLERVLRDRRPDTMAVQRYDIRRPAAEGGQFESRWWSPINAPVMGEDGEVAFIVHRVEDVTEYVRLERQNKEDRRLHEDLQVRLQHLEGEIFVRGQELQEANIRLREQREQLTRLNERLVEVDRLKREFFANVSHELRTPLALILGPAEQLLESGDLPPPAVQSLGVIARNARTLAKDVEDLLALAHLDEGRLRLAYEETDLAALVRQAASHFDGLAQDRRIDFLVDAETSVAAQVDADKIEHVLLNLLSNAFKFTPAGGGISCRLRACADAGHAVVEVADTGPGIPAELREAVFDRFRRLDRGPGDAAGGSGLGLAIAREFTALHGGTITLDSPPEGGARFVVELPLRAPAGVAVRPPSSEQPATRAAARTAVCRLTADEPRPLTEPTERGHGLVLVVEDNPDMNAFLCDILGEDFDVASARDGFEGLDSALRLRPDLVVLDLMLPGMTGQEVLAKLRARPDLEDTAVMILTAHADQQIRVALLRGGAQDHLVKPFLPAELRARARNLVSTQRARAILKRELRTREERLGRQADDLEHMARKLMAAWREDEAESMVKSAFLRTMSHELLTPMNAIVGFTELVLNSSDLPRQHRQSLGFISTAAGALLRMLQDILDFAVLDQQTLRLERIPFNLRRHLEDTLRLVCLRAREKGLEFVTRLPADLPEEVVGDPMRLQLVLLNIVGNAVKFTRHGKVEVEVEVESAGGRLLLRCHVADTGEGVPPHMRTKIFEPFTQADPSMRRRHGGTGLGLALSARLVSLMGGRIWVDAAPGHGSIFHFTAFLDTRKGSGEAAGSPAHPSRERSISW